MASSRILCKAVFAVVATFCVLIRSTFCESSSLSFPQPTKSILGLPTPLPVNDTAHRPVLSRLNIKYRLRDIRSTREISRESIEEANAIIMVSFPCRVKKDRDHDHNQLLQFLGNDADFAQVKLSFVKDNLNRLRERHEMIRIEYEEQSSTATDTVNITELSAWEQFKIRYEPLWTYGYWNNSRLYYKAGEKATSRYQEVRQAIVALDNADQRLQTILKLEERLREKFYQVKTLFDREQNLELWMSLWRSVIDLFKKGMGVLRDDEEIERQKFKTWFNNNVLKVLNQEGKTLTESQLYTWWEQLDCE